MYRTYRVTRTGGGGCCGCLTVPLGVIFLVFGALFPFLWPLAAFGTGTAGWLAEGGWATFIFLLFMLLGYHRNRRHPPGTPIKAGPGPRDWTPLYDDGRREI